jgi:hypothetical protein
MREGAGSPGEHAMCREKGAHAGLVGGGQREGVEDEVVCLGLCPERGRGERGRVYPKGLTGGAGWPAGSVYPLGEWRRGGEKGWRRSCKIWVMHGSGLLSLLSFSQIFEQCKAGVVLGAMLVIWPGLGARS